MNTLSPNPRRVAVGMSGGIDSSVAAALMIQQGYDVVGITMQIYDGSVAMPDEGRSGCFGPGESRDIAAAAAIAEKLGIQHHVIPLASEYNDTVLDYFRSEYLAGRTPNPCVVCNRTMKFGAMLDKALDRGIDFNYFATGHYVRVENNSQSGKVKLLRGVDPEKDQSYFLSQLNQQQLSRLIFPLGSRYKHQVRKLAGEFGLPELLEKPESQDFIECDDYSVLFADKPPQPGNIIDGAGRILGQHRGIPYYTIGQRKGLGIGGAGQPLFVTAIERKTNSVIVGTREELYSDSMKVCNVSWIAGDAPGQKFKAHVKIRQQHNPAAAELEAFENGCTAVVFEQPQMSITPGQTAVFYDGEQVIGGGTISKSRQ